MIRLFVCGCKFHKFDSSKLIMMASRRSMEAVACVMKYFDAASVDRGWCLEIMRGIIARRLTSSPIHIRKRLLLVIVIMGPKNTVR